MSSTAERNAPLSRKQAPRSTAEAVTGAHYVSILSGGRSCLALGPFGSHGEAVSQVSRVRSYLRGRRTDARSALAFGTARVSEDCPEPPVGRLNELLLTGGAS